MRLAPPATTTRWLTAVLVLATVALVGCSAQENPVRAQVPGPSASATTAPPSTGMTIYDRGHAPTVPTLSGTSLTGHQLRLPDRSATFTVVNLWASWCGPCIAEMPVLASTMRGFAGDPVVLRGIDTRDQPKSGRSFLADRHMRLPSLSDVDGTLAAKWSRLVPPMAVPSTLLLDRSGRVLARWIGPVTGKSLHQQVCRALASGKPATTPSGC